GRTPSSGVGSTGDGSDGEGVDEVVEAVAGVALHPAEADVTGTDELDQLLPQVGVGDRLLLRVAPPVALPVAPPLVAEAVDDVAGVGHHLHGPGLRADPERAQRLDHRHQLHPLVGGAGVAAGAVRLAVGGDRPRPAAGPGVPRAGPVGVDHGRHRSGSSRATRMSRSARHHSVISIAASGLPWTPSGRTSTSRSMPAAVNQLLSGTMATVPGYRSAIRSNSSYRISYRAGSSWSWTSGSQYGSAI